MAVADRVLARFGDAGATRRRFGANCWSEAQDDDPDTKLRKQLAVTREV